MVIVCVAVDNYGNVGVVFRTENGYSMTTFNAMHGVKSLSRYGTFLDSGDFPVTEKQKIALTWENTKKFYPDGIT